MMNHKIPIEESCRYRSSVYGEAIKKAPTGRVGAPCYLIRAHDESEGTASSCDSET